MFNYLFYFKHASIKVIILPNYNRSNKNKILFITDCKFYGSVVSSGFVYFMERLLKVWINRRNKKRIRNYSPGKIERGCNRKIIWNEYTGYCNFNRLLVSLGVYTVTERDSYNIMEKSENSCQASFRVPPSSTSIPFVALRNFKENRSDFSIYWHVKYIGENKIQNSKTPNSQFFFWPHFLLTVRVLFVPRVKSIRPSNTSQRLQSVPGSGISFRCTSLTCPDPRVTENLLASLRHTLK